MATAGDSAAVVLGVVAGDMVVVVVVKKGRVDSPGRDILRLRQAAT